VNPTEWRAQGKWLWLNGTRVFVGRHGHGPPVLTLHAFPTASYDFYKIITRLAEHFTFITFDYPGFGFSDKPHTYPYSLLEYATVAQHVCAHFGYERLAVFAHDIGDSVALELLRRGQPQVEGLGLLNGSVWSIPFTDWQMSLPQRLSLHPVTGPLLSQWRLFRKATLRRFFKRIFARPLSEVEIEAFWALIAEQDGAANYHRLMGYMPERWRYQTTWLKTLAAHAAPLTLIWGMVDPVATPAVAEEVMRYRPDATYVPLRDIGHYPHWESPDRVAEAWLAAWRARGSNTSST